MYFIEVYMVYNAMLGSPAFRTLFSKLTLLFNEFFAFY